MMARLEKIAATSGRPIAEVVELWNERAAIRQYDAGMLRGAAEQAAADDVESMLCQLVLPMEAP